MDAPQAPTAPAADALRTLAAELREEGPLLEPLVADPDEPPHLGILVAAGPRCAHAPEDYAAVIEAVREGYLLHYGRPRLLPDLDPDLRLLVGDHLYARGIERLAGLDDPFAVAELSDLISLAARVNADGPGPDTASELAWIGTVVAIACGSSEERERAKAAVAEGTDARILRDVASETARSCGLAAALTDAFEGVGFRLARG